MVVESRLIGFEKPTKAEIKAIKDFEAKKKQQLTKKSERQKSTF